MRALLWLLAVLLLAVFGAFPWLATALGTLVVLVVTGAFTLLMQPPILITALVAAAVVAKRRRVA